MSKRKRSGYLFPNAAADRKNAVFKDSASRSLEQVKSSSYKLAFDDSDFLTADELRPVRLQLELLKPELEMQEQGIENTIIVFGSARTNESDPYYIQARELAALISQKSGCENCPDLHVVTGGGPGIMEAANRGADDVGAESIGLNIVLPHEQYPNPYITPELCFRFHYFAIRKMHFLLRARALVAFPGGFGTMDELFESLTLVQTKKIEPLPILLFGKEYWQRLLNFDVMLEEGMISPEDLDYFQFVDDVDTAWDIIRSSLQES